jgi:hypothetical protein
MKPFTTLTSIVAPLLRDNIDTDTIIPSCEMKSTGKTGLKDGLFAPWRYLDADARAPDPAFVLNQPEYTGAQMLACGINFGCGSSREHTVWALAEYGIRKNNDRVLARGRIMPQIRELISGFTRAEVIAKLEGTSLPFAPIGKPEELFDDPHLLASGGLEPVTLDSGEEAMLPTIPILMNGARPSAAAKLPTPGADEHDVLAALGYSPAQIKSLIDSGNVGAA